MKRLSLLFPGQGSQYVGMGKALYNGWDVAKRTFDEANDRLDFDLTSMCLEGKLEDLTLTANAQPAILTASVAAYRVYMEEVGLPPLWGAGHSLGEITALTCAGAITFGDAVELVRKRGQLMQEAVVAGKGRMSAVRHADED